MLLGLGSAEAQQPPDQPKLTLQVTTEQAMLISQTLERVNCPTVREFVVCQQVVDLLKSLREQVKAQGR